MLISGTFNRRFLRGMDSESTTNRKGFLKRAGLAITAVMAVSSTTASAARKTIGGRAQTATNGAPSSAMARVRTAKGTVARKEA